MPPFERKHSGSRFSVLAARFVFRFAVETERGTMNHEPEPELLNRTLNTNREVSTWKCERRHRQCDQPSSRRIRTDNTLLRIDEKDPDHAPSASTAALTAKGATQ